MNAKELEFIKELKELLSKHRVTLVGHEQYNGDEDFIGVEYEIHSIDGDKWDIYLSLDDIIDSLNNVVKK